MTAVVQANPGALDEAGGSSMERREKLRQILEGEPIAPVGRQGPGCGREQGLEGHRLDQSIWVGVWMFPELGTTMRGAYLHRQMDSSI